MLRFTLNGIDARSGVERTIGTASEIEEMGHEGSVADCIDIEKYMIYNIECYIIFLCFMAKIITTSELQKNIGQMMAFIGRSWVVVTNKGKPSAIMLPYFDDNEDAIAEYLEEYQMGKNRETLQKRYRESAKSGTSSLKI